MNTNDILRKYIAPNSVEDYGAIARQAAQMAAAGSTEEAIHEFARGFQTHTLSYPNSPAPMNLFYTDSDFTDLGEWMSGGVNSGNSIEAYRQLQKVAAMPPCVAVANMPDQQPGYGMPIGGVAAFDNAIAPNLVGVDISCMMQVSAFRMPDLSVERMRAQLVDAVVESTKFGFDDYADNPKWHPVLNDPMWVDKSTVLGRMNLLDKAIAQLGTSGGGNHFVNIMEGSVMLDGAMRMRNGDQFLAVMSHSGSRGVGFQVAKAFSKIAWEWTQANVRGAEKDYAWLPMSHPMGQEYFKAMRLMGRYAEACHDIIHSSIHAKLGGHLSSVRSLGTLNWSDPSGMGGMEVGVVRNRHNYARMEDLDGEMVMMHRKGATPAHNGQLGIIPGSSGSASYIVRGRGNRHSLFSTSHGAGRPRSRKASNEMHNQEAFDSHMDAMGVTHIGVAPDETVFAYKDIEDVIGTQVHYRLADKVAVLRPIITRMGGHADDGD